MKNLEKSKKAIESNQKLSKELAELIAENEAILIKHDKNHLQNIINKEVIDCLILDV